MATLYEIPLTPTPQTFNITLSGVALVMTVVFRNTQIGACWYLTIADQNSVVIADNISMRGGLDLLGQFRSIMPIPGNLFTVTDGDFLADPTFDNLGVGSHLYYYG